MYVVLAFLLSVTLPLVTAWVESVPPAPPSASSLIPNKIPLADRYVVERFPAETANDFSDASRTGSVVATASVGVIALASGGLAFLATTMRKRFQKRDENKQAKRLDAFTQSDYGLDGDEELMQADEGYWK